MRPRSVPLVLLLSLALAGCVSSAGLRPTQSLQRATQVQATQALAPFTQTSSPWPKEDWWAQLGDDQLTGLITEALAHNPSLDEADARVRQAQAQAGSAHAALEPTVQAGGSVAGARLPNTLVPEPIGGHFSVLKYGDAQFSWDLDLWGGHRAAWRAAMGEARAQEVEARAARLALSTQVARAYVQLGYAFDQKEVAQAEYDRSTQSRHLTQQRVTAGLDNQMQLKQDDALVASAEQQQAVAQQALSHARTQLAVLLGAGPDRGLTLTRPRAWTPTALHVSADLPANLLGRRPDLVAARWRVEAARQTITAAKAEFLPNLSLGALAGLATGSGNLFSAAGRFYQVAPALSLPIFDGGALARQLIG